MLTISVLYRVLAFADDVELTARVNGAAVVALERERAVAVPLPGAAGGVTLGRAGLLPFAIDLNPVGCHSRRRREQSSHEHGTDRAKAEAHPLKMAKVAPLANTTLRLHEHAPIHLAPGLRSNSLADRVADETFSSTTPPQIRCI